jgi:hypothetical protein
VISPASPDTRPPYRLQVNPSPFLIPGLVWSDFGPCVGLHTPRSHHDEALALPEGGFRMFLAQHGTGCVDRTGKGTCPTQ